MRKSCLVGVVSILAISAGWATADRAAAEARDNTIAYVNGAGIPVRELREALGVVGGAVPASWVPEEKKKEALDRLIVARLLEQAARAKGLDNTLEFRETMARNEPGIAVNALLRQEAASRVAVPNEEVREEARKLRGKEKALTAAEARSRAAAMVWERSFRRFQEELVAEARKEASATVDEEAIGRIGKGDSPEDNTVLGTVGGEAVRYGEVRAALGAMHGGARGGRDSSSDPVAVRNMVDSVLTRKALLLLAGKRVEQDSEWMKTVRREAERNLLANQLTEKFIMKNVTVTDREIQDAYAKHSGMMVMGGKPIPLADVREQIRGIVLAEKRKTAIGNYIGQLKKKAKIRILEKRLPKV